MILRGLDGQNISALELENARLREQLHLAWNEIAALKRHRRAEVVHA